MSDLKSIKDKARQAYRDQQTQDTEGGARCPTSFVAGFLEGYRQLESEKAALERGIREWQSIHKQCFDKLRIATEGLKEMPCMCPEALGYSKGDKCLVCTTIATIENGENGCNHFWKVDSEDGR